MTLDRSKCCNRPKKGISPVVATVILVAVAV
ncbi:MAG: archaellin/type IV pilin N-terminal domain-containing protein, partial [Nitrososphaerales archaeon]